MHPGHCLTRKDVVFSSGNIQRDYVHWQVEINLRGQKGDQIRGKGSTRGEASGPWAGYRVYGGAVALMRWGRDSEHVAEIDKSS